MEAERDELLGIAHREFNSKNLHEFARNNNLIASCLFNTLKNQGGRTQHKGWKIEEVKNEK